MEAVRDYMTKGAKTISSDTSLMKAIDIMRKNSMGSILIQDNGELKGIFTERDLLNRLDFNKPDRISSISISEVMTKNPFIVDADEHYVRVIELMQQKKIRHLPVSESSKIIGVVSLRDLLSRYEAHLEKLLSEKEAFEEMINEMSDGIVICDSDWRVKIVNTAAKSYLNTIDSDTINFLDRIFYNYAVSISRDELMDQSFTHKSFDLARAETETAKPLYLTAHLDRLENPIEKTENIIISLRDVTSKRKEELMKQDFLGLISHKLRTPMAAISGNISLLQDGTEGELTQMQKERVDIIAARIARFAELIERIIGFTTIMNNRFIIGQEDLIVLNNYFFDLRDHVGDKLSDKKVNYRIDCRDEALSLNINKIHLDLVVMNLVENAIKFTEKDQVLITFTIKGDSKGIQIVIADNGSGIPAEEREKIFEQFYQSEKYFTGNVEGFGLGLTLVRYVMDIYGGAIDMQSEIGKGTSFILSFPK